ncbi:fumarylacetoacetate hydrolase family protein [Nocardioides sp. S-58]|uniref:Fumarylacetoacetate hydrolase family protein n=1 Tax=Nocardioides renjunii TaxID=3095075 RepID=A0ABU5K9E8_9ACTN|nr:fumarylacetoacetate hydrolase family protein [Nocardioides sp. S-58]MDZ5661104.1 fumarylacetoacetate hydrolase family protein [Nocardioides sp. S-58]
MSLDPRIAAGTTRMLARRAAALAAGAESLGWKLGFGAPAALSTLGTDRPLVGCLTSDRLLPSGSSVPVSGWTKPLLEAEVAAHLGSPVASTASASEALAAVSAWSVAIELADLSFAPTDIEEVLGGNIYHRHVLLGPVVPLLPEDLSFSVLRDGVAVASTSTPFELTGSLGSILASAASTLAACGAGLGAGDVVITGSVVPPIDVSGGGSWSVVAPGLGEVGVELVGGGSSAVAQALSPGR